MVCRTCWVTAEGDWFSICGTMMLPEKTSYNTVCIISYLNSVKVSFVHLEEWWRRMPLWSVEIGLQIIFTVKPAKCKVANSAWDLSKVPQQFHRSLTLRSFVHYWNLDYWHLDSISKSLVPSIMAEWIEKLSSDEFSWPPKSPMCFAESSLSRLKYALEKDFLLFGNLMEMSQRKKHVIGRGCQPIQVTTYNHLTKGVVCCQDSFKPWSPKDREGKNSMFSSVCLVVQPMNCGVKIGVPSCQTPGSSKLTSNRDYHSLSLNFQSVYATCNLQAAIR